MKTNFTALDFIVLAAYLIGTTLLGVWLGRNQKDSKDYFVAGHAIPWWAVLFSIVASETSALTFISIPGLAYTTNLGFLQIAVGYLIGRVVIAYTLLPRYYEGNLVTAYALLEKRFGLATRRFTSIVFMVTRGMADSVRVFATAVPIALIIGPLLPPAAVMPTAVLVLGTLTGIYTIRGGLRAVVWTEIVQASGYLIGGIWVLNKGHVFPSADAIFPTFIIDQMPHGLVGLLLAAILAATMSTHSGAINSLAAASTHDIYLPLTGKTASDPSVLKAGKLFALAWGIALTGGALLFPQNPKMPIVVVALSIASFTQGGLLGGFFLGIFWRRAIQRDAITGMAVAITVMAFIVFAKQFIAAFPELTGLLTPVSTIAWPWYVLIGTTITMLVRRLSSYTHPAPPPPSLPRPALSTT